MNVLREVHTAGIQGAITARKAFDLAEKEIRRVSADFRLTFISAGEHIDYRGHSLHWELFYQSPASRRLGIITIEPMGHAWEDVQPSLHISLEVKPWTVERSQRFLPMEFRDSPEAVAALQQQGADWISGGIHMTLSTKFTVAGKAVWHTETYAGTLETDFSVNE